MQNAVFVPSLFTLKSKLTMALCVLFAEGDGKVDRSGTESVQTADDLLSAAFGDYPQTSQEISTLVSHREGFGLGFVLLQFMRTRGFGLPLGSLDLSEFSLGARQLKILLSVPFRWGTLPWSHSSPGVFTASSLPVLTNFFHRLKTGGGGREGREDGTASLKTLSASKCDLDDIPLLFSSLLSSLPPSLETLELKENGFRSPSMETLSSTLAARWLPALLSLDLSDNPLGPFGVRALVRGLSAPLQCLGLARTGAKEKGVEALAEVLKEKRVTSLQTLDLNENEIFAGCFKHLAAALCTAGAVPFLKVLLLKNNSLTHTKEADEENDRDYGPLSMVLSTDQLGELEQLDLSENKLFDEPIGVEGASDRRVSAPAIAAAGRLLKLRILNLANTKIKSGELAALMNAVDGGGVPFLEDLCLSGSQRGGGGEGMQALANTVHSGRLSGVTVLSLCSCSEFSGNAARSLFEAVADGKTPLLSRVEIGPNNRFCQQENYDAAVQTLGRALREGRVPRMEALILNFQIDESASPRRLRSASVSSLSS